MRRLAAATLLFAALAGPSMAQQSAFGLDMHDAPVAVPDMRFTGSDGLSRGLGEYRGRYVLLNVWATWCAPCREELPSLDALQRDVGGPTFEVVALSTDTGRRVAVERLFAEVSVDTLDPMIDDTGAVMRDLGVFALPTTLLINPNGQEIGRLTGPADWNSPEAVAFFATLTDP